MSTTENGTQSLCREVDERLAEVLDGSADATLYDHIADCDACRDLRHEAERAAEIARHAGADFRAPAGFEDKLLAAVEAVIDSGAPLPRSGIERQQIGDRSLGDRASFTTAPTQMDAVVAPSVSNPASVERPRSEKRSESAPAQPTLDDEASVHSTSKSGVAAVTQPEAGKSRASGRRQERQGARSGAAPSGRESPSKASQSGRVVSLFRKPMFMVGLVGAVAAAAAAGFFFRGKTTKTDTATAEGPWGGKVAAVARASSDKTGGFEACDAGGACAPVAAGAAVRPGSTLRTDARTRAHVVLDDGTQLALDRGSEVVLDDSEERSARLVTGTLVADVAEAKGTVPARFGFPQGEVEVLGTKLSITAGKDRASVEVARGAVRVRGSSGKEVDVRAGEEATLSSRGEPMVASTTSMADVMEWSDRSPEEVDSPVLRGLGELRARKPGQTQERDRAVRLAKHSAKVRIVDVVARTEVDETFTNDTDEELEGIF